MLENISRDSFCHFCGSMSDLILFSLTYSDDEGFDVCRVGSICPDCRRKNLDFINGIRRKIHVRKFWWNHSHK